MFDRTTCPEDSNAAASAADPRRETACLAACQGIPTAELEAGIILELVAACVHLREDERVLEILNRLSPLETPPMRVVPALEPAQESPAIHAVPSLPTSVSIPVGLALTAPEKFRVGMRVRVSPTGCKMMPPTTASLTGTVRGFSESPLHVRIARDGRTSPEKFHMDYWETDPDYREVNESAISGLRALIPIR